MKLLQQFKWLFLAIGIAIILSAFWFHSTVKGYLAAQADIARGNYKIITYGSERAPWSPEFVQAMRNRYGIEYCVFTNTYPYVTKSFIRYTEAYNSVSYPAMSKKFGTNVFNICIEDAKKSFAQKNQSADIIK